VSISDTYEEVDCCEEVRLYVAHRGSLVGGKGRILSHTVCVPVNTMGSNLPVATQ